MRVLSVVQFTELDFIGRNIPDSVEKAISFPLSYIEILLYQSSFVILCFQSFTKGNDCFLFIFHIIIDVIIVVSINLVLFKNSFKEFRSKLSIFILVDFGFHIFEISGHIDAVKGLYLFIQINKFFFTADIVFICFILKQF